MMLMMMMMMMMAMVKTTRKLTNARGKPTPARKSEHQKILFSTNE
jgi:hypothetical protein